MSRQLAALDRALLAVLGLVLVVLGLWPLLLHFKVPVAEEAARWVDHGVWASLPTQTWWPYALGAATIVLAIGGLWLIIANLRHRRFNAVESQRSDTDGAISTHMAAIAAAVAADLQSRDGITKVRRLVAYDRARPTLQYTIEADPDTPLPLITEAVETNERDFRAAFPDADLDTTYKVHFTQVRALKS